MKTKPKIVFPPNYQKPEAQKAGNKAPGKDEKIVPPPMMKGEHGKHRFIEYVRSEDTGQVSAYFKLETADGAKEFYAPLQQLTKVKELHDRLTGLGIPLSDGTQDWLMSHATQHAPATTVVTVGGWRDTTLVNCYGTYGVDKFRYDPHSRWSREAEANGNHAQALRTAKPLLEKSSLLTFLHCLPLWASLAALFDHQGGLAFCITGDSSTGKTNATRYALSITSRALTSDLLSVNQTPGYADAALAPFGGALVPFSDLKTSALTAGQLAKFVRDVVFNITESGRRMRLTDEMKPNAGAYKIALMSYETRLTALFAQSDVKLEGGEARRFFDLEVRGKTGIFDGLSDPTDSLAMTKALEALTQEHYGLVMPQWAKRLMAEPRLLHQHEAAKATFMEQHPGLSGVEHRICEEFANIYGAGVLARSFDLLPVEPEHLTQAITKYFQQNVRKTQETREATEEYKTAVMAFLTDAGNYPVAISGCEVTDPRAFKQGFLRDENGKRYLYVQLEFLQQAFSPPVDAGDVLKRDVLQPLQEDQVLLGNGPSPVRQIGLGRARRLRFDWEKLQQLRLAS